MGWRKACELRARQKLAEESLQRGIARAQARIERLIEKNGKRAPAVAKWRKRIDLYRECLERVRTDDWGAREMERI